MDPEEEEPVPHVLELDQYDTTEDAEYDSWLLLEKVEPEGGEEGAPQQDEEEAGEEAMQLS